MNKNKVINLGCRLNSYESEKILKIIEERDEKTIVVNTCSVTQNAEKESIGLVKKFAKSCKNTKIYVTGCASQLKPELFQQIPGVYKVVNNENKLKYQSYGIAKEGEPIINKINGKTRGFVEIQNGCNHNCTFCNIHIARGKNRSKDPEKIISEIKGFLKNQCSDITLTGVDISGYGDDIGLSFNQLIKKIIKEAPEIQRMRFSSLDVAELNDEFIKLFSENRIIMPYIHLSLQSGDNLILKRMRRRHSYGDVKKFYELISSVRDNVTIGADIIVGFPTETEEMFQNTMKMVREIKIKYAHIFQYSPRDNTPAKKMPQVSPEIIKSRAVRLKKLVEQNTLEFHKSMIGKKKLVLIESSSGIGLTEEYSKVRVPIIENTFGKFVEVMITEARTSHLIGEFV